MAKRGQRQKLKVGRRSKQVNSPGEYSQLISGAAVHYQTGQVREAQQICFDILQQDPNQADALHLLGAIAYSQGQYERAIALYQQSLALNSANHELHNNIAVALVETGKIDEAIGHYRQALEINPSYAECHSNLGNTLRLQGKLSEAIACLQWALHLRPDYPEAHNNLGVAFQKQKKISEAIANYQRAIELRPDYAEAHKNLGMALLLSGEMKQGLAELEWRWQCGTFAQEKSVYAFEQPLWDGRDLQGRTILLYSEQGMGDAIQFIRYVPLVKQRCLPGFRRASGRIPKHERSSSASRSLSASAKAERRACGEESRHRRGGKVRVECQEPLLRVFGTVPGIDRLVERGTALPEFDVQASLMTLPHILGTTLDTIPAQIPYLRSDSPSEALKRLLAFPGSRQGTREETQKVGIVWRTNPASGTAEDRSCKLSDFLPLLELGGIAFYSLQKGEQVAEIAQLGRDNLIDLDAELQDFADTAAAMQQLDLIITVDTAVAHLAGALGKPVWVLLPFVPDWRWMLDREDSPWYPTMRLFRQSQAKDWSEVFVSVREALQLWMSQ